MITDAEIIELERLLWEQNVSDLKKGLVNPVHGLTNPNYVFLFGSIKNQKYDLKGKLSNGYRGCVLEGSSRSGKTWSGVDIIIWLCLFVEPKGCSIKIYRDVYASFKDTLYDDFKKRLDDFGLNNPFHNAQEVKTFKIGNSRVSFLGCDKIGKAHGSGCDYAFFNEGIFIPKDIFDQVEMRCRKFWWIDYNPSFSDHWIFDSVISRPDVGFLRTTFKDNPHLSNAERNKILSYEPWLTNSYEVKNETELWYNGSIISDTNQPPPHPENVKNGTADVFMWTVYGLGLRGAMQGVIFNNVYFINESEIPYHLKPICTIDFGFTNDPCAINRYYEDDNNIYIEPLTYKPIDNPEAIGEVLTAMGITKAMPIICDSADKYTHENKGAVEMVYGLQKLGWKASKVSKTKSVMYWITSMKKKKIHIIINHLYKEIRKERENYKWKEINGILINQPEDKFNHCFVGETEVLTSEGLKRIDIIQQGDLVMTEEGFNRVAHTWNNGYKQVNSYLLQFDMFNVTLECTPNHLIKTNEGWIEIQNIKSNQILYLHKTIMEKHSTYIQEKDTFQEAIRECMSMYGKLKTNRKYQKGFMFTTKTQIRSTMNRVISNLKKRSCTNQNTLRKDLRTIQNGLRNSLIKVLKQPKNGTDRKKGERGIKNMRKCLGLGVENMNKRNANNVMLNSHLKIQHLSSVQAYASQKGEESRELTMSKKNATYVKLNLVSISIQKEKHAAKNVAQVYDLAVENNHSYFANGILVHNCWDSARYGHMASNKPKVDSKASSWAGAFG